MANDTSMSRGSDNLDFVANLKKTQDFIGNLDISDVKEEAILLSCLLLESLSQMNERKAILISRVISEFFISEETPYTFRAEGKSELSKTELSKERWGLDPNLILRNH